MRHGRTLSNRAFRLQERFRIIRNEKYSLFDVTEIDQFLLNVAIWEFLIVKFSKGQKALSHTYFLTSFLGPKIWNLVLLVSNPKKYVKAF